MYLAVAFLLIFGLKLNPGFSQPSMSGFIGPQQFPIQSPAGPVQVLNQPISSPRQYPNIVLMPYRSFRPPPPPPPPRRNTSPRRARKKVALKLSPMVLVLLATILSSIQSAAATTTASVTATNPTIPPVTFTNAPIVDPGKWSDWTDWTTCSREECGTYSRTRECIGGNQCIGNQVVNSTCNEVISCNYPGVWSAWSSWSVCTDPCTGGTMERTRSCSSGAGNCYGSDTDTENCPSNSLRFHHLGVCYELFEADGDDVSYDAAEEICEAAVDGTVADIPHQDVMDAILGLIAIAGDYYTAMGVDTSNVVTLSDTSAAPTSFVWASGAVPNPASNMGIAITLTAAGTGEGMTAKDTTTDEVRGVICENTA